MTTQNLWQRLRRKPFTPFRIHLSGGTYFDIHHPEQLAVAKTGVDVLIHDEDSDPQDVPDRFVMLSPLHITSVEDLRAKPKSRRAS
jgi:hypothetical protein